MGFFGGVASALDWFEDTSPNIINSGIGVTVTANATANTKGSWTQLIASSSGNTSSIVVSAAGVAAAATTNTATLLDIGTGASGSETTIIADVAVGASGSAGQGVNNSFEIPFKIPSGTRISARIQSVVAGGKTASISAFLMDLGNYDTAPTSVDVIGADTANSKGISFSGASGSWNEAIASTSRDYRAVCCVLSSHNSDVAGITITWDVGIGASGSEVVFGGGRAPVSSNEVISNATPYNYLFGRKIPAGSRLAVRHNIAANPDRYGFTLIGVP
jgi:hypothetical protein